MDKVAIAISEFINGAIGLRIEEMLIQIAAT